MPEARSVLKTITVVHDDIPSPDKRVCRQALELIYRRAPGKYKDFDAAVSGLLHAARTGFEKWVRAEVISTVVGASDRNFRTRLWFHGTRHPTTKIRSAKSLKCPRHELGIHFGSPAAAIDRLSESVQNPYEPSQILPARLRIRKSLLFPADMGEWHDRLRKNGLPTFISVVARILQMNGIHAKPSIHGVRDALAKQGYDSILYHNPFEGARWPGDQTSIIIWDPALIELPPEYQAGHSASGLACDFKNLETKTDPLFKPGKLGLNELRPGWPPKALAALLNLDIQQGKARLRSS